MLRFLLIHNIELPVVPVDAFIAIQTPRCNHQHCTLNPAATIPLERLFKETGKGPVHLVFGVAVNKKIDQGRHEGALTTTKP
jgi:hypothetical protein